MTLSSAATAHGKSGTGAPRDSDVSPLHFSSSPRRILALGAHCDDIEIGCGGTLRMLARIEPSPEIKWVVCSGTTERVRETRDAISSLIDGKDVDFIHADFPDGFFPSKLSGIKHFVEQLKTFAPDLILTHCRNDLHQDHRTLNEVTWNTFRNHLIWEYEILKYDGDLGNPNLFVPLDGDCVERKLDTLMTCFPSQLRKHWFNRETFFGLLRVRGVHAACEFAEAFYCHKASVAL